MSQIILDTLFLRRPRLEYISPAICPPICPSSASASSHTIAVAGVPSVPPPSCADMRGGSFLIWCVDDGVCFNLMLTSCPVTEDSTYTLFAECVDPHFVNVCSPGFYKVSIVTESGETALSDPYPNPEGGSIQIPLPVIPDGAQTVTYRLYYNPDTNNIDGTYSLLIFWPLGRAAFQVCTPGCYKISTVSLTGESDFSNEVCMCLQLSSPQLEYCLGASYSSVLTASGGVAPYFWDVIEGSLPPGLILDSNTGLIDGTPTSGGVFTFTLRCHDSVGTTATTIITMRGVSIDTNSLPDGMTPVLYSSTLASSGTDSGKVWSVVSGALPDGLSLNASTGEISGRPLEFGTFNFRIKLQG